jgi:hypothetical protein
MVLSYARGSWRFKVASSVAVAVRYGNVGGSFSGNEELVASLVAECEPSAQLLPGAGVYV